MNERLRDLMLQAGYAAPELAGRAQNLAELIVRECARVAFNDWCDSTNEASSEKAILELFGFEE